ncbi:cytochrome P450 [bacterium]|nr:cytochrome P450 [bacterium]
MAYFNPLRMAYHLDPYPALAQLRREEPVHRSKELNAWVLTAYETCNRVLHDDDTFSSDPIHAGGEMGASIAATRAAVPLGAAPIMGNSDDPVHARIRTIVNRAFVPRVISAIEPRLEDIAGRMLEQLGIPADDRGTFRAGAQAILAARSEGPSRIQAASEAHNLMTAMLGRWQQSGDVAETSVLGTLLHAADDERLSPDEMLMTLIHIASAGNGPTAFAIGNAVLTIGQHREALARLMEGPEHLPSAVEEALRFDSPTHMISRFARRDADLGGRKIRAGDMAYVVIGAANRDPDRFPDADTFDTARTDNRHLSFGIATHFCLGAPLARLMIATALSAVMGSFGRYRLLEAQRGGTLLLRGPGKLVIAPE